MRAEKRTTLQMFGLDSGRRREMSPKPGGPNAVETVASQADRSNSRNRRIADLGAAIPTAAQGRGAADRRGRKESFGTKAPASLVE